MSDERRAELTRRIKSIAREQVAERGAAALSLSRIARKLEMTTPALYRYFASRDELVSALVVDAYTELGEVVESALEGVDRDDLGGRYEAFMMAYRRWALAHPQDYILIHGAVLPGYKAPIDRVAAATFRVIRAFVELLMDAERLGRLRVPPELEQLPDELARALQPVEELPAPLLLLAFFTWLEAHSLVWQEIAGHLPPGIFEEGRLFRLHVRRVGRQLGLIDE
ncbi:MAG TPA: TetR/AcrR family transcriptional regulator [Sandaracinaceae bacterium]